MVTTHVFTGVTSFEVGSASEQSPLTTSQLSDITLQVSSNHQPQQPSSSNENLKIIFR